MTGDTPEPMVVPAGLRERVLEASWQARAVGGSVPEVQEISPAEAFSRAADAFYGLLCALADEDWPRPVLRDLDVQGLVGHLIGVEEDVQHCLANDPGVAKADHVASTQAAATRQAGRPPAATRGEWHHAAGRSLDLVGAAAWVEETWSASATPGSPARHRCTSSSTPVRWPTRPCTSRSRRTGRVQSSSARAHSRP